MDYFAMFLCAGCVVLSGFVLNVEACLPESSECVRLSQVQSINKDQMPEICKNLTKSKSCFDKVLRECKSADESRMISMAKNSTEFQYNTYCVKSENTASISGPACLLLTFFLVVLVQM